MQSSSKVVHALNIQILNTGNVDFRMSKNIFAWRVNMDIFKKIEPWWPSGLIEHNRFLVVLDRERVGSNPASSVKGALRRKSKFEFELECGVYGRI
jgi:hypothetical protein